VKLRISIVPVLAAAAFAGGCASWNARDGNDFQCEALSNERHRTAAADRQDTSDCGANYAAAAIAHEVIREGMRYELGHG
jgi:hypothetical protein